MGTLPQRTDFGSGMTEHPRVVSLPQRVGAVLPVPPLVMATLVFLGAIIAVYAQVSLIAKGNQPAAAAMGRFAATGMLVASAAMIVAISVAIVRVLGAVAIEHAFQRRQETQRLVAEFERYREREEKLMAMADAMKRERDETALPLAS